MGIPITINDHELNTFDMHVEPGAEYLVTVGKTASSVKVERVIAEPDDALIEENKKLRELVKRIWPFAKCWLGMLPALGMNDSESYDIEAELCELRIEVDE